MTRFLLVSNNERENLIIQKRINYFKYEIGNLGFFTTHPRGFSEALRAKPDIVIFNTRELDHVARSFVMNSRENGYRGPLVVLARAPLSTPEFQGLNDVVILRKPYEPKSLAGVIKNIIQSQHIKQRKFPRYNVRESAEIEGYENEFHAQSMILNISKGGVFVYGNVDDIRKGELVRIHFHLHKINKERTMSAKVVWSGRKREEKDSSAGLEFVSQMAVYDYLLKYALA